MSDTGSLYGKPSVSYRNHNRDSSVYLIIIIVLNK